tara:strand:- start:621 stop:1166 length:546 start_codon:yes stop_codon:yes gene_type:complete
MKKSLLWLCVFIIIITSSLNPYIKKSIINTKNEIHMPFEIFYIFISFLAATIVSFVLFFYKRDMIYLGFAAAMCILTSILFNNRVKKTAYPTKMYAKSILSACFTIIPSFLFVFLIKSTDVSYLDPIIKPLILTLIFVFGVFIFGETRQNTTRKWLCIIGIIILVAVFQINKTNLNDSTRK